MADVYTLYALQIGTTVIDQIRSQTIDPGLTEMLESGDSSLDNLHVSVNNQSPTITFSTTALKKALDVCGVAGLLIDEAGSSNGIDLFFRKRAMGGGYAAGSSHLKLTVNLGVLIPTTLPATHPEAGSVEFMLYVVWDGTNNPILIDKDQSVSLSLAFSAIHTIGPWWINGVQLLGMTSMGVDFGLTVETKASDGEVWPRSAHIISRGASMTGTTRDLAVLDRTASLGILGVARSAQTRAFLRKKAAGAALVEDATAEHIRFDINAGRISPQQITGEHQADASTGILVTPIYDGSNAPIVYAADVAVG